MNLILPGVLKTPTPNLRPAYSPNQHFGNSPPALIFGKMKQSTKVGEILDEISPEIFPVEFKFEFKFPQNPSKLTLLRGSPARLGFGSVGTDQTVGASLGSVQKKGKGDEGEVHFWETHHRNIHEWGKREGHCDNE